MGLGKSVGQVFLYIITSSLVILGLTDSSDSSWMLILIGVAVLLAGRYFKKQMEAMGY